MTDPHSTRLSSALVVSDDCGAVCAEGPGAVGVIQTRPGDELLGRLPVDRGSHSLVPLSTSEATFRIDPKLLTRISEVAAALGVGLDEFFLTAFVVVLARLAGQESATLRNLAGDPAVLTLHFAPEDSFRSLLAAIPNAHLSTDQSCAIEFLSTSSEFSSSGHPERGLRLTVMVSDGKNQVHLSSTTGLWSQSALQLWLRYFEYLLTAAVAAPDTPWKTLPLLEPRDSLEFYRACNKTATAHPSHLCVQQLVKRQVERTPDAVAIVSESRQISYRELDERSDIIARQLIALGASRHRPVAVCLERAAELPIALLSVLKSGSCYVPLDPQDARQRLTTIVGECQPVAMIVDQFFAAPAGTESTPLVYLDCIPEFSSGVDYGAAVVEPDQLAYIIYTSGTTGKPKGVMISHGALSSLLQSIMRKPGFSSSDRMLAVAPISFDIATMDMFLPLVAGGTLVVADRYLAADPSRLAAMLEKFAITVLQATPSVWRLLASSGWQGKRDLKMISGGETLPRDLANQLLHLGGELWNCYGPTETTIYSSVLRIQSEEGIVPLGPPIADTTFYVLDPAGQLLPPGVPGELYIGGVGVGAGYLKRPQITQQRFLTDPYSPLPDACMFRSGDLVRLLNDREFEIFGRLDHQVKLRGYRIEPEEIESVLRAYPGIDNALAALRDTGPGEPHLIAYITVGQHVELRDLRKHLAQWLPSYMVPSQLVVIEAMPLTSSGKIDRQALLVSDSAIAALPAFDGPKGKEAETALEEKLLSIFRDVLKNREIGVTDSFFDYGGYSVLTVKLFTRINRALSINLPISLLFDAPTVRALAEIAHRDQTPGTIVPVRPQGSVAPLFVIHSYLLYGVLPEIVELERPVYGVREPNTVAGMQRVEDLAAVYVEEILKIYASGPLLLTGWCAAGSLTVEIARQLCALGHQVGLVALFDAERPGYRAEIRGGRTARVIASVRFHRQRFRKVEGRQKLDYLRNVFLHQCGNIVEALFMHHRPLLLCLQRLLGFSLPDAVFNNTQSRLAAIQNCAPASYPGRVLLFRALDVPQIPYDDETLGWKDVADNGVEVVFVPGDHESMFHEPNVNSLRKRLLQAMQLAERG